jgi:hypothetical protein
MTPSKLLGKKKCSETKPKAETDKVVKSNKKSSAEPVPLNTTNKPKPIHINEIEAKFAMSALKLKYQERRFAKPAICIVNKIAKKGKLRFQLLPTSLYNLCAPCKYFHFLENLMLMFDVPFI